MSARAAVHAGQAPGGVTGPRGAPGWWDTYALSYAFGLLWLAVALFGLGTQPTLSFSVTYDLLLVLPPVATAISVLLADRVGSMRSLPWRAVVLASAAGFASVVSTVALTPLLVLMFREGVGRDLGAIGLISTISLTVVGAPMAVVLVEAVRKRRWVWVAVLFLGVCAGGVVLAMALSPGGTAASLLRLDQAEIMMITVSWWLPWYAAAAAFARRLGMA